jgi:hypothetical protein
MAERQHNYVREGVIAGVLGATAIAVWFLIVDSVSGHPLYTPQLLGQGLANVLGKTMMDSPTAQIVGYTIFHYAAFILIGIILTLVIHQADRTPGILAGLLVAVVVFELGFYILTALFSEGPLGQLAWYQIFIANLLAAGVMSWYLWKSHPRLTGHFKSALEGTDD